MKDSLMSSELTLLAIQEIISRIETMEESQLSVDQIYSDIKQIFKNEIDKLPDIPSSNNTQSRKTLHKSASFWNPELQELWSARCKSESAYASYICKSKSPQELRQKQILLKMPLIKEALILFP